ncbi:MAG: hypothetical protein JRI67_12675 [Deltaproteobacteria bacterium]|nr:hypothetical protein [Deltaproteobacteria bacterium]
MTKRNKNGINLTGWMNVFSSAQDMPSIDLSQMLGSHPGVWFLFGCIFVVVLLVLMEFRRKGV